MISGERFFNISSICMCFNAQWIISMVEIFLHLYALKISHVCEFSDLSLAGIFLFNYKSLSPAWILTCVPAWHLAGLSTHTTWVEFLPSQAPEKRGQMTSVRVVLHASIHRISLPGELSDAHRCELDLKAHHTHFTGSDSHQSVSSDVWWDETSN